VTFLNTRFTKIVDKQGAGTAVQEIVEHFKRDLPKAQLVHDLIQPLATAYVAIERYFPLGKVPPTEVVTRYVATEHRISPSEIKKVRKSIKDGFRQSSKKKPRSTR